MTKALLLLQIAHRAHSRLETLDSIHVRVLVLSHYITPFPYILT